MKNHVNYKRSEEWVKEVDHVGTSIHLFKLQWYTRPPKKE